MKPVPLGKESRVQLLEPCDTTLRGCHSLEEGSHQEPTECPPDFELLLFRAKNQTSVVVSHPVCGSLLQHPKWTKTVSWHQRPWTENLGHP